MHLPCLNFPRNFHALLATSPSLFGFYYIPWIILFYSFNYSIRYSTILFHSLNSILFVLLFYYILLYFSQFLQQWLQRLITPFQRHLPPFSVNTMILMGFQSRCVDSKGWHLSLTGSYETLKSWLQKLWSPGCRKTIHWRIRSSHFPVYFILHTKLNSRISELDFLNGQPSMNWLSPLYSILHLHIHMPSLAPDWLKSFWNPDGFAGAM